MNAPNALVKDRLSQSPLIVWGAGAFGRALAFAFSKQGLPVLIVARAGPGREEAAKMGLSIGAQTDLAKAQVLFLAMPAEHQSEALNQLERLGKANQIVLSLAKGLSEKTLPELAQQKAPSVLFGLVSGPSFAVDLLAGKPTALTLAHPNAGDLCHKLSGSQLRFYPSADLTGVAIFGAMKNVIAIACGLVDGLDLGHSARSALMTRGLFEIKRLSAALGGLDETASSLAGIGDLSLTCNSIQSRNFSFGRALAKGEPLDAVLVEGKRTCYFACTMASKLGIELPISAAVQAIIDGRLTPQQAVRSLMTRPLPRSQGGFFQ